MARVAGGEGSSLPPGSSWDTPRPAAGRADQTLFLTACLLSRVGVCELKHRSRQGPLTGGLQARIPEWAATPSSRGSSRPRD